MTANPVEVLNAEGTSKVVLICEHASYEIPQEYKSLGLASADLRSHAAWDPGARALGVVLSATLDAPLVAARISRLVYDCNRPPDAASAMPKKSELIEVPGNQNLTKAQREARTESVYQPFCSAVSTVLDARGPETIVVTLHSFTPVYFGKFRPVEVGLLHDADTRLVDAMLTHTNKLPDRVIKRNEPYGPRDGVTHSLQIHAVARGLANVMIEVRNDLLQTQNDVESIARELLILLNPALKMMATREEIT